MFRFGNIEFLWLLWIIPLLALLFIATHYARKRKLKRFGDLFLLRNLMPEVSFTRKLFKFILMSLALASVIFALARPQFGTKLQEVKSQGVELVIAIDVSNSMLAEDIKPSRLQNTRIFVQRILSRLKNDKIALIVFAGEAFVQMPLTDDINAARMFLSTINTDVVPIQGTAIGRAIELGARSFSTNEDISKIIIVITDGEDHEDNPVYQARAAAEKGIIVHTVGMGLPGGAPIPQNRGRGFLRDIDGNVVTSALDEKVLQDIATDGKGIYVRASNNPNSLDDIIEEIDKLKKGEVLKTKYAEYDEQFQYFIALAIMLIIINAFISERKNKILSKINLFKTKES